MKTLAKLTIVFMLFGGCTWWCWRDGRLDTAWSKASDLVEKHVTAREIIPGYNSPPASTDYRSASRSCAGPEACDTGPDNSASELSIPRSEDPGREEEQVETTRERVMRPAESEWELQISRLERIAE